MSHHGVLGEHHETYISSQVSGQSPVFHPVRCQPGSAAGVFVIGNIPTELHRSYLSPDSSMVPSYHISWNTTSTSGGGRSHPGTAPTLNCGPINLLVRKTCSPWCCSQSQSWLYSENMPPPPKTNCSPKIPIKNPNPTQPVPENQEKLVFCENIQP